MDRIVFEDNEKTETSKLLRVVWSGVEFAGSINGMIDYLGQYCCSNTEIVVMVDVVPDRSKTVLDYKSVKNFCKENLKNTTIIPMLYYEYYLIRNTAKLVLCNITLLRYVFEYSPEYREISVYPLKLTLLKDIVNMCIKHSDTLVCRVESKGFLQENVVVAYALMQRRCVV